MQGLLGCDNFSITHVTHRLSQKYTREKNPPKINTA